MSNSFPLPTDEPDGLPQSIQFVEIDIKLVENDPDPKKNGLHFILSERSGYYNDVDVDGFLRSKMSSLPRRGHELLPPSPLDFEVEEPCYVAVNLVYDRNWRFRVDGPAITTKKVQVNRYMNLVHASTAGNGYDTNADMPFPDRRCTAAYFSVARTPPNGKPWRDGLNLFVDFVEPDGRVLSIIIDPTVKNEGPPSFRPEDEEKDAGDAWADRETEAAK